MLFVRFIFRRDKQVLTRRIFRFINPKTRSAARRCRLLKCSERGKKPDETFREAIIHGYLIRIMYVSMFVYIFPAH